MTESLSDAELALRAVRDDLAARLVASTARSSVALGRVDGLKEAVKCVDAHLQARFRCPHCGSSTSEGPFAWTRACDDERCAATWDVEG